MPHLKKVRAAYVQALSEAARTDHGLAIELMQMAVELEAAGQPHLADAFTTMAHKIRVASGKRKTEAGAVLCGIDPNS